MTIENNDFTVGTEYKGFRFIKTTPLPALRATALELEHAASGARLLHLHTEDTENCFAVAFPTPPPDETGIPHILEHSVLAGSKKYPVFEPFFEMVKISMATFINALTSQMFTVYPIATTVKRDFFNLADVYMDAIFYPNITESTFRAEGHHFTLADNNDLSSDLKISGIVYSEMKGYWSTPDNLISNLGTRGLFPDTPLHRDSGGNPAHIPELTYEKFKEFHETYYHPSNALFYLYGDIPTKQHLDFLAPLLKSFEKKEINIPLQYQPRWTEPRQKTSPYPIGESEKLENNTYIIMDWLVADATNPIESIELSILSNILLGSEAAPLKKAIIDSRLGADIYPSGDFAHAHEVVFEVGIKGSEKDKAEAFTKLINETLLEIAENEIDPEQVESAFHQIAFHHLEVSSQFPIKLLWLCAETWPYGKDPLIFLRMEEHIAECKKRYADNPNLFNEIIKNKLLNNPHRLTLVLYPDKNEHDKTESSFTAEMKEQRAKFSDSEIAKIAEKATALSKSQTKQNSPEQLASLPQLHVNDLPDKPQHIPTSKSTIAKITVLRNDIFTNGINYLNIDVDISGLPNELYAWIPHFVDAASKMGTSNMSYEEIAHKKNALTGGLNCNVTVLRHSTKEDNCLRRLRFKVKSIDDSTEDALNLLYSIIHDINPRNSERLLDITRQSQADFRTSLVHNAMKTARNHAGRGISPEAALGYLFSSRETLYHIDKIVNNYDTQSEIVMQKIEQIRDFLSNRNRWTISFTGSDHAFSLLATAIKTWSEQMNGTPISDIPAPFDIIMPPRQGLAAQLKVGHCTKAMKGPSFSAKDTPLYELGLYLAQFDYFLPQIRFKGNAYGAGAQYNGLQRILSFYSYNDPRIKETLDIFNKLKEFINDVDWSQTHIDRAIIGAAKAIVTPIRPAIATEQSLTRHIAGISNDIREQRYSTTKSATPENIKNALLAELEIAEPSAGICVAASREKLEEANAVLGKDKLEISDIF